MGTIASILLGVAVVVVLSFLLKKKSVTPPVVDVSTTTVAPGPPAAVYTWYATGVQTPAVGSTWSQACGGAVGQVYYSSYAPFAWNSISHFYLDTALTNRFKPTVDGQIGYTEVPYGTTLYVAHIDTTGTLTNNLLCSTAI